MNGELGVWVITGAARGLGREVAAEVLSRGGCVVAAGRNAGLIKGALSDVSAHHDRLLTVELDLLSTAGAEFVVEQALLRFGRIDKLINNAGYGLLGAVEEADDDEIEAIFQVNVFGVIRLSRAALPELRKSSGHIVNISSLGGFAASGGWGIYNATKFAVEGFSEALALETAPLGVKVTIVEPGSFRTGFLSKFSMKKTRRTIKDYEDTAGTTREVVQRREGHQIGNPRAAAKVIVDAVSSECPPLRLVLGADAIRRIEGKLIQVRADVDAWRIPSIATAF